MAELDIAKTTTSDMTSAISDYSVDSRYTDGVEDQDETYYDYPYFTKWFGYYKTIPELKKAIDALAMWTIGKGFEAKPDFEAFMNRLTGWGEDTAESILWNLLVTKKLNGDAFAEIIRDTGGNLMNLKPLDPSVMRVVVDRRGVVKRYEQRNKNKQKTDTKIFKPYDIFHIVNDRVADEIHGTSVIESCETVILARNEALEDYKKLLHRNIVPLRIIEVDTDDITKRNTLKAQYETAIKKGEVLIVPKGNVEVKDYTHNIVEPLAWIKYLEDFFYQAVGVPKVILGGSSEFTEASSKIAYLTFEQVYAREQRELEQDLLKQLGVVVKFVRPASLKNETLNSEQKNTGQVGFQPNDTTAGVGEDATIV